MQMVSLKSQWSKYIAEEKNIVDTKKMFFGKFMYKAEVTVFCASRMRKAEGVEFDEFVAYMDALRQTQLAYEQWYKGVGVSNYSTSQHYRAKAMGKLSQRDDTSLYKIRQHISTFDQKTTKLVLEKDKIHFYTVTDGELTNFLDFVKWPILGEINKIFTPSNDVAKTKLEENLILVSKPPKFKYKVLVTDGKYTVQEKTNIMTYLANFPDDVYMARTLKHLLNFDGDRYLSAGKFYVNDLSLLSFLKIISPRFVNKIYTLEHLPNK